MSCKLLSFLSGCCCRLLPPFVPSSCADLVQLASKILNSVAQHDKLMENEDQVEAAQAKFDDIMNSGTLEEACNKIDALADRQQLDSTLMLMITKAWAAAKESNMMKDEVSTTLYCNVLCSTVLQHGTALHRTVMCCIQLLHNTRLQWQ